jgi:hypothetical protein
MDKTLLYSIAALIVMVTAGAAVFSGLGSGGSPDVRILSITTDQPVYHSKETMQIHIEIFSSDRMNDLTVVVDGITDQLGRSRLEQTQFITLEKGSSVIAINFTLPVCSKCAGLPPGEYTINASVQQNNVSIARGMQTVVLE